uniref:CSON003811 protein n=1 Tax=Culicoides sonorensis TaxID=179676 RepID=A0A336L3V7_CULSO
MIRVISLSVFLLALCFVVNFVENDAAPLQSLPQKPGYVPVYIRYGDTPLEQINLGLAVAFREGGEARNIQDKEEEMMADEPAQASSSSESKEDEAKTTTQAPMSDSNENSASKSESVENDTKEEEVPHALPVKEKDEKKVE